MNKPLSLLRLLQLCNSSLPVGAYSYSDGLETLCEQGTVTTRHTLQNWLQAELAYGSIGVEATVMIRAYRAWQADQATALRYWNSWYTANRETEELRSQSLQMGRSLLKLLLDLDSELTIEMLDPRMCNFCIAFGMTAAHWQIECREAALGYLQSWVVNVVNAGVKLIPLGQTQGQQIILELGDAIAQCTEKVLVWEDDQLESNSWGMQLASMAHETQYSRIFRS